MHKTMKMNFDVLSSKYVNKMRFYDIMMPIYVILVADFTSLTSTFSRAVVATTKNTFISQKHIYTGTVKCVHYSKLLTVNTYIS